MEDMNLIVHVQQKSSGCHDTYSMKMRKSGWIEREGRINIRTEHSHTHTQLVDNKNNMLTMIPYYYDNTDY